MRVMWSLGIIFLLLVTVTALPAQAAGTQTATYRVPEWNPLGGCRIGLSGTDCLPKGTYDPVGQFSFSDSSTSGATISLVDNTGADVLFKVAYGGVSKVCVGSCSVPAGAVKVMIEPIFFSAVELAQNAGVALPTSGKITATFA